MENSEQARRISADPRDQSALDYLSAPVNLAQREPNAMTEADELMDRHLDKIPHLPSSPGVIVELLKLFRQPDRDIDEVVHVLNQDPPIAAEVLKRCNSAMMGGGCVITDVFDGVSLLGFYEVYRLVVGVFGARSLLPRRPAVDFDVEALWRHSVLTAVTAGTLARHCNESEAEAYTAALLHDVGKVILAMIEGKSYKRDVAACIASGIPVVELEQAVYGFDHPAVGARLLTRWNLPPGIVTSVRHHHDISSVRDFEKLAATVYFANVLSNSMEEKGAAAQAYELTVGPAALEILQLEVEQVAFLLDQAQSEFLRMRKVMGESMPM